MKSHLKLAAFSLATLLAPVTLAETCKAIVDGDAVVKHEGMVFVTWKPHAMGDRARDVKDNVNFSVDYTLDYSTKRHTKKRYTGSASFLLSSRERLMPTIIRLPDLGEEVGEELPFFYVDNATCEIFN